MLKAYDTLFDHFQEIQRLQKVIAKVRFILTQLQQAIKGEVVMTEELQETLYAVYDAKVGQREPHRNKHHFYSSQFDKNCVLNVARCSAIHGAKQPFQSNGRFRCNMCCM